MEQKPKKYYLIPLIIGIFMIVMGIVLIILALVSQIPEMGADGWFEASGAKSGKFFGGGVLVSFGVFVAAGISSIVYTADPVVKQRRMEKVAEQNVAMEKIMSKHSQKTKTCLYCGAELQSDKFECPHCGAKQTKK